MMAKYQPIAMMLIN